RSRLARRRLLAHVARRRCRRAQHRRRSQRSLSAPRRRSTPMTARRIAGVAVLVALLLLTAPVAPRASAPTPAVSVSVDRTGVVTSLGHEFAFRSTITNRSASTPGGLIAHLNVLSYDRRVYVDPEDWSSHR